MLFCLVLIIQMFLSHNYVSPRFVPPLSLSLSLSVSLSFSLSLSSYTHTHTHSHYLPLPFPLTLTIPFLHHTMQHKHPFIQPIDKVEYDSSQEKIVFVQPYRREGSLKDQIYKVSRLEIDGRSREVTKGRKSDSAVFFLMWL